MTDTNGECGGDPARKLIQQLRQHAVSYGFKIDERAADLIEDLVQHPLMVVDLDSEEAAVAAADQVELERLRLLVGDETLASARHVSVSAGLGSSDLVADWEGVSRSAAISQVMGVHASMLEQVRVIDELRQANKLLGARIDDLGNLLTHVGTAVDAFRKISSK